MMTKMKITRKQLRQIISEETRMLHERRPAGNVEKKPDSGSGKWIGNTRFPAPKLGPREKETLAITTKEKWDASKTVEDFEKVMSEMKSDMKEYMTEGSELVVRFVAGLTQALTCGRRTVSNQTFACGESQAHTGFLNRISGDQ